MGFQWQGNPEQYQPGCSPSGEIPRIDVRPCGSELRLTRIWERGGKKCLGPESGEGIACRGEQDMAEERRVSLSLGSQRKSGTCWDKGSIETRQYQRIMNKFKERVLYSYFWKCWFHQRGKTLLIILFLKFASVCHVKSFSCQQCQQCQQWWLFEETWVYTNIFWNLGNLT